MIQVNRGLAPQGFEEDATALWQEYQQQTDLTASQFWAKKRRKIKGYADQLHQKLHEKCVYCEYKPTGNSGIEIEHYRPLSIEAFESDMFKWNNWLSACQTCNRIKGVNFPICDAIPCLIDPASENPEVSLGFIRESILPKNARGKESIELLELNRIGLVEKRVAHLIMINHFLLLSDTELHGNIARQCLIASMQAEAPYSAMTKNYLREIDPSLADPVTPHPPIDGAYFQQKKRELLAIRTPLRGILGELS